MPNFNIIILIAIGIFIILIFLLAFLIIKHHSDQPSDINLENNLRDEKQISSIILDAIEDAVIMIDKNGIIQLFNPGAAKMTGWAINEAKNLDYKSILKLVDQKGEPYSTNQDLVYSVLHHTPDTIRDNDATLLTHNNLELAVSISVSPLLNSKKETSGVVAVMRDVTQERIENKQRTEFISTASHEMRTPVAAIEGYLALALNDKVSTIDDRARNYLEKAHESTQHLGKLFQDLLTSAKAEDGRLTSHPQITEISDYLEKLTNDLRFAADKKNLALEFNLSPNETIDATSNKAGLKVIKPFYYVNVDPDRMREVITNLFDNAVKYTEQGKISIGLTADQNIVQIYIKDTGVGIPQEDIPHLFQKFYRVDNSATRTIGGTGLGLYICRKIVELYQGKIWVESDANKGSTFFINLPRISTEQANQTIKLAASDKIVNPIPSFTSPVIQ